MELGFVDMSALPPRKLAAVQPPHRPAHPANPSAPRLSNGGVEIIHAHAQLSERRREPRFDCEDEGTLIMMQDGEALPCRLMDQSSGGARIMHARTEPLSGDMWLIRKDQSAVCRASMAWSMPHRAGLRFTLIQKLSATAPCPPKVPAAVYRQWLMLNGPIVQAAPVAAPEPPAPKPAEDDPNAFFLD